MSATPRHDRLLDLLADQATGPLTDAERGELDQLLDQHGPAAEREVDAAIAGLMIAFADGGPEEMPAGLRARLVREGERLVRSAGAAPASHRLWPARLGWLAAAVFAIVAAIGWWPRLTGQLGPIVKAPTYSEQLAALTAQDPQTQIIDFEAATDPAAAGVSGKVYWSGTQQRGFMRLKNLPANDPAQEQYQLWLFDDPRGMDFPVDGGVFDLADGQRDAATGEYLIPIHAKLPVHQPVLFAVTIEKPDGVVVTKRERLVLTAKPGQPEAPR